MNNKIGKTIDTYVLKYMFSLGNQCIKKSVTLYTLTKGTGIFDKLFIKIYQRIRTYTLVLNEFVIDYNLYTTEVLKRQ